jgi:hypothetical protein
MASRAAAAAPPALTEEGVKLLFLDLDGVICCNYHGELEADKLSLVGKIVEETGCRVVLSTDWRRQPHLRARAEETLSGFGVTCIGVTPQYPMYARGRPKEILAWMAEYNGPIAAWCALDDRDLVLEEGGAPAFINHFVLTEFATGLTEPLAQRVIVRLVSRVSLPNPHSIPEIDKDGMVLPIGRPNTMQELDYNLLTEVVATTLDVCRKHYGSVPAIPELMQFSQQALENLGVKGDLKEREADFTKIVDMMLHGQDGTCAPPARRSSRAGMCAPPEDAQDAQNAPCPPPPPCPPPFGWWTRLLPRRMRPTIEHDQDSQTKQLV